jgi:biotin synthase-related radical SAM superfamily protein
MGKHIHVNVGLPNEDEKQAEAAKTVRLRALRLAKEATDQEDATREVARTALRSRGPRISHPTPQAS